MVQREAVPVFHCHQAVEKLLKAYLVEQDREAKKIHDLTTLRTEIKIDIPGEYVDIIDELQPHYLIPRYPDLPFSPQFSFTYNKKSTEDIFKKTRKLFIWLEKKLMQKK